MIPSRRRRKAFSTLVAVVLSGLLVPLLPTPLPGQTASPAVGVVETGLLLRQLDGEKRVLMVGAHPDDEDTSLLTALARGEGARAAYLSLSRGEGGQNLIGPELEEGLGIIRTGELLSARSVDGAEQYFARAFDFGFSKSAEETFRHWPEEELLRDVVWVIRSFRPQVVLSVFHGSERDGHGQHQAAGVVTHEAFRAAGDPSRFPDQLEGEGALDPWAPLKLYRLVYWEPESATLQIPTGGLDPLLGRSHFQVAMDSRSRHRSQDMGAAQTPGPRTSGAALVETRVRLPDGGDDGFFAGVDTALVTLARSAGLRGGDEALGALEEYREGVARARRGLPAESPGEAMPHLLQGALALQGALDGVRALPATPEARELRGVLERRSRILSEAILAASSVVVEVRAGQASLVPGEEMEVEVLVWNGGSVPVDVEGIDVGTPAGWTVRRPPVPGEDSGDSFDVTPFYTEVADPPPTPVSPATVDPGSLERWSYRISAPVMAKPSRPYYLQKEREEGLYVWPEERGVWAAPGTPPLLTTRVALHREGVEIGAVEREAVHVDVDKALGEFRVPVHLLPALSVSMEPRSMAWPGDRSAERPVTVRVTNHSGESLEADVRIQAPPGWRIHPTRSTGGVGARGGEGAFTFYAAPTATMDSDDGEHAVFQAVVQAGGRSYEENVTLVDYPHIDPVPLLEPSELLVSRFHVEVREGLRVGYLMGPGDGGIQALQDLGVEVELLDPETFRSGDLDRFDAIVLGVRAYETRSDLVAANERLLGFARRGGTVIVQYNKYEYPDGGFAPFPLAMRRPHDRVTDPAAPVTLLDPDHPLLSSPNRIGTRDFEGWIQERGLYFLSEWDERYVPLLEMADEGEEPNRGSLVVARVGAGAYVYSGLALFRQFPAGVPGAFRLLANLVSLTGEDLERVGRPSP